MATVTITIPDEALARVRHALCVVEGLPESNANAKEALARYVRRTVIGVERFENTAAALDGVPAATTDEIAS